MLCLGQARVRRRRDPSHRSSIRAVPSCFRTISWSLRHDCVVDPRLDAVGGGPPTLVRASRRRTGGASLPMELQRRFEAVVFDWDGTAVQTAG